MLSELGPVAYSLSWNKYWRTN